MKRKKTNNNNNNKQDEKETNLAITFLKCYWSPTVSAYEYANCFDSLRFDFYYSVTINFLCVDFLLLSSTNFLKSFLFVSFFSGEFGRFFLTHKSTHTNTHTDALTLSHTHAEH